MRSPWLRLGVVVVVVLVLVTGTMALHAFPSKKTMHKCQSAGKCSLQCDPSAPPERLCQEGKDGPTWPSTYECCCCVEGWQNHYYGPVE